MFGLKVLLNHPHLILSLQGRGSKKSLLPWREKVRMRGIIMDEVLTLLIYSCNIPARV